jgi:hypothetical protein
VLLAQKINTLTSLLKIVNHVQEEKIIIQTRKNANAHQQLLSLPKLSVFHVSYQNILIMTKSNVLLALSQRSTTLL